MSSSTFQTTHLTTWTYLASSCHRVIGPITIGDMTNETTPKERPRCRRSSEERAKVGNLKYLKMAKSLISDKSHFNVRHTETIEMTYGPESIFIVLNLVKKCLYVSSYVMYHKNVGSKFRNSGDFSLYNLNRKIEMSRLPMYT